MHSSYVTADIKLLEYKPSTIAASALISASHELCPQQYSMLRASITACEYLDEVSQCPLKKIFNSLLVRTKMLMVFIVGDIDQVLWPDTRDGEDGSKRVNHRYKLFKH